MDDYHNLFLPVTHTGSELERMVCEVTLRVSLVEPPSDVVPQPGHKEEIGKMISDNIS